MIDTAVSGSFRDPSGFLFYHDGVLHRRVNTVYEEHYSHLIDSGLYAVLTNSGLLVHHEEVSLNSAVSDGAFKVLRPEMVGFISYPYEWCFGQLKDAALATLEIQKESLKYGMSLKDSSAYNIQFVKGKPVLIDTLSFEKYREGEPWVAYRQFCQHFLAPLALMSYRDVRLGQLLRVHIDGVPLDLASSLLPFRARFSPLLLHIYAHSVSQRRYTHRLTGMEKFKGRFSRTSFMGLISSLESAIRKLKWDPARNTGWDDYYASTNNYALKAINHKKQIVSDFLDKVGPGTVWDLGANTGLFSRIASRKEMQVVCFDNDPVCVERNYRAVVENQESNILPLMVDLANPSPGIGWENEERLPFAKRGHPDTVLALALIHHLAISNNLPLNKLANFFRRICNSLIIEFIPKNDSNAQRLLATREDVFENYSQVEFEREFGRLFSIKDSVNLENSKRTLYLMVAEA